MIPKRSWIGLFVAPALVNLILWGGIFSPQQKRLQVLQGAHAAVELRPSLESSLKESDQILLAVRQSGFPAQDPSAVSAAIQRLAQRQRTTIASLKTTPAPAASQVQALTVEAELTGSFNKLASWIGEVEQDPRFQISSWAFSSGESPNQPARLTVKLTALLRRA